MENRVELATHATPILTKIHGVEQIIFFCQSGLVSLLPRSGKELWRQEFPYKVSTAASPVVAGDLVYCSAGYGVGAGLYKISKQGTKFSSQQVWRKPNDVINHWSTPVYHDGHLYGMFSFKKYGDGPLQCVELKQAALNGARMDTVLVMSSLLASTYSLFLTKGIERGRSLPQILQRTRTEKLITGKCWSTPTLSGGKFLYAVPRKRFAYPSNNQSKKEQISSGVSVFRFTASMVGVILLKVFNHLPLTYNS